MFQKNCVVMAGFVLIAAFSVPRGAAAQTVFDDPRYEVRQDCWRRPAPATVEETLYVAANGNGRRERNNARMLKRPALLALSGGDLAAAYSAGLLLGWGETGERPDFDIVTAAGASALIAPFVFAGPAADQRMADVFTCKANNWEELAHHAAALIDMSLLDEIARRHSSGAKLIVGLQGSAARRETVWDLGAIAASSHPERLLFMRKIMRASVDLTAVVAPDGIPVPAGHTTPRNWTFRKVGAGEAFVRPALQAAPPGAYVLIHNADWFTDESDGYVASRRQDPSPDQRGTAAGLLTAYDLFNDAERHGASFRMAAIRPGGSLIAKNFFDQLFMRALLLDAFRQGRMGKGWSARLPRFPPRP